MTPFMTVRRFPALYDGPGLPIGPGNPDIRFYNSDFCLSVKLQRTLSRMLTIIRMQYIFEFLFEVSMNPIEWNTENIRILL